MLFKLIIYFTALHSFKNRDVNRMNKMNIINDGNKDFW